MTEADIVEAVALAINNALPGFQIIFGVFGVAFGVYGFVEADRNSGNLDTTPLNIFSASLCIMFGGLLALIGVMHLI